MSAAVEARPEVSLGQLWRGDVHRVVEESVGGEVAAGTALGGVGPDLVAVGVRGDPPRLALGEQAVPQPADGRGHPVEPAEGAVALQRIAREAGGRVGTVVVETAPGAWSVRSGDARCLVAGRTLHADRDRRFGVPPAADL